MLPLMCISKYVNNIAYPCKICHVNVNNKDSLVQFDICQSWVHIKCNKLNLIDYKYLQGSNEPWYCLSCCRKVFPFGTLANKNFIPSITNSFNKVPRVMKVCFHWNLLTWLSCIINLKTRFKEKTMTLQMLLTTNTMTLTKSKL